MELSSIERLILEQLQANYPQLQEVDGQTHLQNDLGMDSLNLATMVAGMNASLGLNLESVAEHMGEVRTVADLSRLLYRSSS